MPNDVDEDLVQSYAILAVYHPDSELVNRDTPLIHYVPLSEAETMSKQNFTAKTFFDKIKTVNDENPLTSDEVATLAQFCDQLPSFTTNVYKILPEENFLQ